MQLSPETICHALWECLKLVDVWDSIPDFTFRQLRSFPSFRDLVFFVHVEGKNHKLMAMIMWTLWYQRNQLRVGLKEFLISQVIPQASQSLSDFKMHLPQLGMSTTPTLKSNGLRLQVVLLRSTSTGLRLI
nr:hypothetical protein CFP56_71991 [Quercus suber]